MKQFSKEIRAGKYSIFIGNNVFVDLKQFLSHSSHRQRSIFILCDENSMKHCYPFVPAIVKKAEIIIVPAGEKNKNIDACKSIWQTLSHRGADRKSLLINLGGGVIGDMGGFAASTFKRGIDFIHIPTTLLAQVDASIGGKTGINLNHIKNEIGIFNFPKAVFIYPEFLNTLDERQIKSGFAEIIKHALIADRKYWNAIQSFSFSSRDFSDLIIRSVEIKNKIVKADPKEKGIRKTLNFGHTIGHALEACSHEQTGEPLFHGEAVATGMVCEAYLSYKKLKFPKEDMNEIASFVFTRYQPIAPDKFDDRRLIELMQHDKKNTGEEISFSLLRKTGKAEWGHSCSVDLIRESFNYYKKIAASACFA